MVSDWYFGIEPHKDYLQIGCISYGVSGPPGDLEYPGVVMGGEEEEQDAE